MLEQGTDLEKAQAEVTLAFRKKWQSTLLKDISQLPDLSDDFMAFVLTETEEDEENYIVISYHGKMILKEMRGYEYYWRFIELGKLFKEKYGSKMVDLVPEVDGLDLYGDRISAPYQITQFRKSLRESPDDAVASKKDSERMTPEEFRQAIAKVWAGSGITEDPFPEDKEESPDSEEEDKPEVYEVKFIPSKKYWNPRYIKIDEIFSAFTHDEKIELLATLLAAARCDDAIVPSSSESTKQELGLLNPFFEVFGVTIKDCEDYMMGHEVKEMLKRLSQMEGSKRVHFLYMLHGLLKVDGELNDKEMWFQIQVLLAFNMSIEQYFDTVQGAAALFNYFIPPKMEA